MAVVTINGQIGSGILEVGSEVAKRLGYDYVDRLILAEAGKRVGATVEALAEKEQQRWTLGERVARLFRRALEHSSYAGTGGDPFFGLGMDALRMQPYPDLQETITEAQELDDQRFFEVVSEVIRDLAEGGDVVIIARGGNMVLENAPNCLHVGAAAPMPFRIKTIMARQNLDEAATERFVNDQEQARIAYFRRQFKADPDDPTLYHIVLNPSVLGFDTATDIIVNAVSQMK